MTSLLEKQYKMTFKLYNIGFKKLSDIEFPQTDLLCLANLISIHMSENISVLQNAAFGSF